VPDELFATASVAAATVWTAAAAAVKHEHATKNYRRAFIELISRMVRCSKTFLRIHKLSSILEKIVYQCVRLRVTVLYEHCDCS